MKRVYVQMCNASNPIKFDDARFSYQYGSDSVWVYRGEDCIAFFPTIAGAWLEDSEETEK